MLKKAPIYPYIPATDMARARRFYEQTLGFTPSRELTGGIGYDCGQGTGFFLYSSLGAGTSKASQAFWVVDDVVATVAELRAKGVKFVEYDLPGIKTKDGIASDGAGKIAWFTDPEGNILAITQRVE